jgi:hypothetical protein
MRSRAHAVPRQRLRARPGRSLQRENHGGHEHNRKQARCHYDDNKKTIPIGNILADRIAFMTQQSVTGAYPFPAHRSSTAVSLIYVNGGRIDRTEPRAPWLEVRTGLRSRVMRRSSCQRR